MELTPAAVRLRVGELVLHGVSPADRHRVADALRAELARLLAEHGVPPHLAHGDAVAALDAGRVDVPHGARPAEVGRRVAAALYRGLASGGA